METKIIQITAGKGSAECSWVVAKVLKVFIQELKQNSFGYEIVHREEGTENGTIQSVTVQLKGRQVSEFLKAWLGTIQWVGTSTFRKHHKRKNWFVGMFEIQNIVKIQINDNEIQFQAIRSSGPGGQHVNKVSSAIRAKHVPTEIQVVAMDSRSQHQNKKLAIQRLQDKVAAHNQSELQKSIQSTWENHLDLERGNPVQIFKGTDFKMPKKERNYKSKRQELKINLKNQLWD